MIEIIRSLEDVRKAKDLTQEDMARELNVAVSTYNQYENGARSVPREKAELAAAVLGVSVSDIFLPTKFTISKT